MQAWLFLLFVATAICVAVDASRLGASRGALGGGFLDMGPAGWFFACLLLWIVALPCYLATRPKLARRARALAVHPQLPAPVYGQTWSSRTPPGGYAFAPGAPPPPFSSPSAPTPVGPPPGYYPNPDGQGTRWWDGANWAPPDT